MILSFTIFASDQTPILFAATQLLQLPQVVLLDQARLQLPVPTQLLLFQLTHLLLLEQAQALQQPCLEDKPNMTTIEPPLKRYVSSSKFLPRSDVTSRSYLLLPMLITSIN
jgi:hypothetical protein